jgi:dTDP-4-dehydrorhamnose reductase
VTASAPLALWGGVECTVNRVGDTFRDQLRLSGHDVREDDLARFAALGFRTLRFPVLWERTAPAGLDRPDWRWPDARLAQARALGIRPIVTLLHHGSGPRDTHLLDPAFPERLADYARAVAERYPWVTDYTPVNEPLTTARFSALYGLWYPHARGDREFVRAVLAQCRAIVLAMRAIREVTPDARLVQTEDLGRSSSTALLAYQANFDNDRRWLAFDLVAGRLTPTHRMWRYLRDQAVDEASLDWFRASACPPDIVGINHYLTSNRYLDSDLDRYPPDSWGGNGRHRYADVAAVRVEPRPAPPADLLMEAWERYRLPLAITEAHLGCTREEQLRWLLELWQAAHAVRTRGADVRAVTAWALLGAFDWDSLLTRDAGHYEPGAFDVRGPVPRLTALGRLMSDLAHGRAPASPAADGPGWWHRPIRLLHGHAHPSPRRMKAATARRPLLVTGGADALGAAIARIAELRGLEVRWLSRDAMDVASRIAVEQTLTELEPWAVVNAGSYMCSAGESEPCPEHVEGCAELARACAERGVALVTFSSERVFSGRTHRPYVESDPCDPTTGAGAILVEAERRVSELMPEALIVRTSAGFSPWETVNPLTRALDALRAGEGWTTPRVIVSPTYWPDLVNTALDLLIDGERGLWHLTNGAALSWHAMVTRVASRAGIDLAGMQEDDAGSAGLRSTALASERGQLLPALDDAIARFIRDREDQPARACPAVAPAAGA